MKLYHHSFFRHAYSTIRVNSSSNVLQGTDRVFSQALAGPSAMGTLRHSLLTGSTFDDSSATAWFSNFGYHDVATSLAAVHAALLRARDFTAQLHVYNHPLEATYANQVHTIRWSLPMLNGYAYIRLTLPMLIRYTLSIK